MNALYLENAYRFMILYTYFLYKTCKDTEKTARIVYRNWPKRPTPYTTHILMKPSNHGNQKPLPWLYYAGKYLVIRYVWNSGSKMLELPSIFFLPRGGTSQVAGQDGLGFVSMAIGDSMRLPPLSTYFLWQID